MNYASSEILENYNDDINLLISRVVYVYLGADCSEDINDCMNATCYNGGTCVDGIASFSCNCVEGYSGALCQENIDDCIGSYCGNGR